MSVVETVILEETEVQERFLARGWTDGLPIVPPTPEQVDRMLAAVGLEAEDLLGVVPQRNCAVSAGKAAVNAVMAGCPEEAFPIVVAALQAILDPAFNAHAVVTSTGGAALCLVVSGRAAEEAGMNAGHNVMGPGRRANATIGRALRLVVLNVLRSRPGEMDGSSLGHPGKYTLTLAEDPPPPPWKPLRVALGYLSEVTTVTVLPTEGPRQVANHLNPEGEGILRTFAAAIRNPSTFCVGKGGQGLIVLGPEHARAIVDAGLTRQDVQEYLVKETRVAPAELEAAGVYLEHTAQHDMRAGPDGKLPTFEQPEDVYVMTAGGAGAGWSAYVPGWAPTIHARAVTRVVRRPGEWTLPDCGLAACDVDRPGEDG